MGSCGWLYRRSSVTSSGSVQCCNGAGDALAAFFEDLDRSSDRQTEIRRQSVRSAGHHGHTDAVQQVHHDIAVLLQHVAVRRALANQAGTADVEIERTIGHAAAQTWVRVNVRQCRVASLFVDGHTLIDDVLVAAHRRYGGGLAYFA